MSSIRGCRLLPALIVMAQLGNLFLVKAFAVGACVPEENTHAYGKPHQSC